MNKYCRVPVELMHKFTLNSLGKMGGGSGTPRPQTPLRACCTSFARVKGGAFNLQETP